MQGVLGEYGSLADAQAAVRSLELRGQSIQNIVIADERERMWRRFRPLRGVSEAGKRFVVCMIDELRTVERVRSLLLTPPS